MSYSWKKGMTIEDQWNAWASANPVEEMPDIDTDTNGKEQEAHLQGLMARVCLHEYDHMQGKVFTEHASKLKLHMAKKKAMKMMKVAEKRKQPTEIGDIDAK